MRATLLFVIAAAAGLALVSAQTGGCSDPECRCSGWAFIDEECQRCPAGTFQGIGMGSFHECLVCSPPLTSAEGSTTCGCAAGRYMDLQASDEEEDVDIRCPKCQAGFYNPSIGQTTCLNCPPGTTSQAGAVSCDSIATTPKFPCTCNRVSYSANSHSFCAEFACEGATLPCVQ